MVIQNNNQYQDSVIKTLGERKIVCSFHDVAKTWDMQNRDNILHALDIRPIGRDRKMEEWQGSSLRIFVEIFRRIQSAVQSVTRIDRKIVMWSKIFCIMQSAVCETEMVSGNTMGQTMSLYPSDCFSVSPVCTVLYPLEEKCNQAAVRGSRDCLNHAERLQQSLLSHNATLVTGNGYIQIIMF